jgi:hypothetical protein
VSPVKYELDSYIPEDDILHSDRRENLKSYITGKIAQFCDTFIISSSSLRWVYKKEIR